MRSLEDKKISIDSKLFEPFWSQLFSNIGYSREYKRHVIVEPICYLVEREGSIEKFVPIDPLVYGQGLGIRVASFIDEESSNHLEQALVPYILNKKYKYILLSDSPVLLTKDRLREFLNYLKRKPHKVKELRGLVHYHIDEPKLSEADIDTMTLFTKEIKSLGGNSQIGIVVSERDPEDTLEISEFGKKGFIDHLSTKLKRGRIDVVGELFTGKPDFHSPVEIRIGF